MATSSDAVVQTSARIIRLPVRHETRRATVMKKTVAAAVCPDGKLEVEGDAFKRGTAGRSRPMTNVVDKKTEISSTIAIARRAAPRHHRAISSPISTTTTAPTTGPVFSAIVAILVTAFQP